MLILGLTKTTLLDYPGRVAASIFTGGCNFRCPYCHNKDIVLQNKSITPYALSQIWTFLKKRQHVLTGVCITGGEPTLHHDLPDFIRAIKELNYNVKLDTNGTHPQMLDYLITNRLIDYCAMDIKNSPENYNQTVNIPSASNISYDWTAINDSVTILMTQANIPYEFRTTVTAQLHTSEDMRRIAAWIAGAKAYFLQPYVDSDHVLCQGFCAPDTTTLESYIAICREKIPNTQLRGI